MSGAIGGSADTAEPCLDGKSRTVTTLVSADTPFGGIKLDADSIYFIAGGTQAANYADYSVMKVPLAGGTPTTLASGLRMISDLAIGAQYAYLAVWGNFVAASEDPALDAVMRVPLQGGTLETVAPEERWPRSVAVDSTNVYWALTSGEIKTMPLSGGTHVTLATGQDFPESLLVDDTNVYWANEGTSGRPNGYATVMKVVKSGGGEPVTLATAPAIASGIQIAIDGANIYWTFAVCSSANGASSCTGSVNRVPKSGGPSVPLASALYAPGAIAVDSTHIYWVDEATGADPLASIVRMPTGGGTPVVLATGQMAESLAIDAQNVYWTNTVWGPAPDYAAKSTLAVMPKECPQH